jgi:hypothetical protein
VERTFGGRMVLEPEGRWKLVRKTTLFWLFRSPGILQSSRRGAEKLRRAVASVFLA